MEDSNSYNSSIKQVRNQIGYKGFGKSLENQYAEFDKFIIGQEKLGRKHIGPTLNPNKTNIIYQRETAQQIRLLVKDQYSSFPHLEDRFDPNDHFRPQIPKLQHTYDFVESLDYSKFTEGLLLWFLNERRFSRDVFESIPRIMRENKIGLQISENAKKLLIDLLRMEKTNHVRSFTDTGVTIGGRPMGFPNSLSIEPDSKTYLQSEEYIQDLKRGFLHELLLEYSGRPRFPLRLAVLISELNFYQLPEEFDEFKSLFEPHYLGTDDKTTIGTNYFLCAHNEALMRNEEMLRRTCFINDVFYYKTFYKSAALCLQNAVSKDGAMFVKGVWYSPVIGEELLPSRDEIKQYYGTNLTVDGITWKPMVAHNARYKSWNVDEYYKQTQTKKS